MKRPPRHLGIEVRRAQISHGLRVLEEMRSHDTWLHAIVVQVTKALTLVAKCSDIETWNERLQSHQGKAFSGNRGSGSFEERITCLREHFSALPKILVDHGCRAQVGRIALALIALHFHDAGTELLVDGALQPT